ncbi:MAG: hypothetical protein AB4426_10260 [Xenococcaceae cyanobacterium]
MKTISRRRTISWLWNGGLQFLVGFTAGSLFSCHSPRNFSSTSKAVQGDIAIIQESGSFLAEIRRIKQLALPKESYLYQPPTTTELTQFSVLAKNLISQNFNEALYLARDLNYELVQFIDNSSKQIFYGLREKEIINQPTRGWGSYFINPAYRFNALVEAPHILFDQFSLEIASQAFLMSAARGFLMAGAHRNANGYGTADVCDSINSIFQVVHEAWIAYQATTWQIHGFLAANKLQFPDDTQVVLSNAQGAISAEILVLNENLESRGFPTYVYNQLPAYHPLNQRVNKGITGTTFSPLAATQNVQGISCHRLGTPFVHIEIERRIRTRAPYRDRVAGAIAESIQEIK